MLSLVRILVSALVFGLGLSLTSCEDLSGNNSSNSGGDDNQTAGTLTFEGTWRNPFGSHPTFTFTNDSFVSFNDSNPRIFQGSFTFTDSEITFIPSTGDTWTQGYTLSATELILTQVPNHNYGTFVKQ
jgi:hypothetical protein